jgi:hypothetical protein
VKLITLSSSAEIKNACNSPSRQKPHGYIPTDSNLQLDVILFADDLTSLASSDDLKCCIYNFHIVASKYNMDISVGKSKVMAFRGKGPVPSKVCLNSKMTERTNSFTYLVISYHFKERYIYCKKKKKKKYNTYKNQQ